MGHLVSDYAFHPPSGSNVPGKVDANPFMNCTPNELRRMIKTEGNPEKKQKMLSALKQWERQYTFPGYPYRQSPFKVAIKYIKKLAEIPAPAINVPYYQDAETPSGLGEVIDSLYGLYDNDNNEKFDYKRHGERPIRDVDMAEGDFSNPKEPSIGDVVKERGDGPDPINMDYPFPPTGGDIDGYPDN
jgi:hypothetical protein